MVAAETAGGGAAGQVGPSPELLTPDRARLVITVFLLGVLVTLLLGAGILLINFGLISKRPQDRTGTRNPSDLGLLQNEAWPESPYQEHILPAEDEEKPREDETRTA